MLVPKEIGKKNKILTPLLEEEWKAPLEAHGFEINHVEKVPMHLLHPKRLIEDEGILGVAKIIKNVAIDPVHVNVW